MQQLRHCLRPKRDPRKKVNKQQTMTPNTRKRKSRLAEELMNLIADWELGDQSDTAEVMLLSMKNPDIVDKLQKVINKKKTVFGRKITSFETCKLIWDFYHDHATPSTSTSRPAKLKASERNNIQTALDFVDTTHIVAQ